MAQLGNTTFTGNVIGQLATFTKLIKNGLDDTSVLLAGGGHKALSGFSLSGHTHTSIKGLGPLDSESGRTASRGGVYSYKMSASTGGYKPTTYAAVIGFGEGTGGTGEIALGWTGGVVQTDDNGGYTNGIWYRGLRDYQENWYGWTLLLDTHNWSTYCAAASHTHAYIPLSGTTITNPNTSSFSLTNAVTGNIIFSNTGNDNGVARGIGGVNGATDGWVIRGYLTANNKGCLEIATGDDGDEAIYVRQYTAGGYKLPFMNNAESLTKRELILMQGGTGYTLLIRLGVGVAPSTSYVANINGSLNATSIYLNGTSLGTAATHAHGDYAAASHTHSQYLTAHQSLASYALKTDIPTSLPANGGNADTLDGYHATDIGKAGWINLGNLNPKSYVKIAHIEISGTWKVVLELMASGDVNYCNFATSKLYITAYNSASASITLLSGPNYIEYITAYIDTNMDIWVCHEYIYNCLFLYKCLYNDSGTNVTLYKDNFTTLTTEPSTNKIIANGALHYVKSNNTFYVNGALYNNANNVSYTTLKNVNVEGSASYLSSSSYSKGNSCNPIYFTGGLAAACTMSIENSGGVLRSFARGTYNSANQYFGNGTIVTIDPKGTGCLSANDTIISLGDKNIRNTLLLCSYNADGIYYRRITDNLSYGDWKRVAFLGESLPASDVSAWAKAATKPTYSWGEITGKPTEFTPSSHTHTKSLITDFPTIPTSLPANGGNADTVDSYHISDILHVRSIAYKRDGPYYTKIAFRTMDKVTWMGSNLTFEVYSSGYSGTVTFIGKVTIRVAHHNNTDIVPEITCLWVLKGPNAKDSTITVVDDRPNKEVSVWLCNDYWDSAMYYIVNINVGGWKIRTLDFTANDNIDLPTAVENSVILINPSAATYVGNLSGSASDVAWANISDKPASATRWPAWSEVTGKPTEFTPASHTHSQYLTAHQSLANYVTLNSALTITGNKTFTGNILIGTNGAGGTIYGNATDGGCNSIKIGNDVTLGDVNAGGIMGMKSTGNNAGLKFLNSAGASIGGIQSTNGTLQWINASNTAYDIYHTGNLNISTLGITYNFNVHNADFKLGTMTCTGTSGNTTVFNIYSGIGYNGLTTLHRACRLIVRSSNGNANSDGFHFSITIENFINGGFATFYLKQTKSTEYEIWVAKIQHPGSSCYEVITNSNNVWTNACTTGTLPTTNIVEATAFNTLYSSSSFYLGTTSISLNRASANLSLTGINIDGSSGSCTGNAASATKLATSRNIWGKSFNGSADITGYALNFHGFTRLASKTEDWSDGVNTHPWYGLDWSHCTDSSDAGKSYSSISSYFGLYLKTASGNLVLHQNGNVGIGTGHGAAYKLDVAGTAQFDGAIYIKNNADGIHQLLAKLQSVSYQTNNRGGGVALYAVTANATASATGTQELKVNIWADSEGGNLRLYCPTDNGNANKFYYSNATGTKATSFWEIDNYNGDLRFYSWDLNGTATKASANIFPLTLTRSNKVGIGTASPTEKLTVAGNIEQTGSTFRVGNKSADYHFAMGTGANYIWFDSRDANDTMVNAFLLYKDYTNFSKYISVPNLTIRLATGTAPMTITSTTKVDNLNVDLLDGYHASDISKAGWYVFGSSTYSASDSNGIVWVKIANVDTTANDNIENDMLLELSVYGDLNYTSHIHGYLRITSYGGASTSIVLSTDPMIDGNEKITLYATIDTNRNIWIGRKTYFTCRSLFKVLIKGSKNTIYYKDWVTQRTAPNSTYITKNGALKNSNGTVLKLSLSNVNVDYATSAGAIAWDNVTGKPSTFTPSSHTHDKLYSSETSLILLSAGNELTCIGAASFYINYTNRIGSGTIPTLWIFNAGSSTTYASIKASSFYNSSGTEVSYSGHTHSYLPLSGGTVTGYTTLSGGIRTGSIYYECDINGGTTGYGREINTFGGNLYLNHRGNLSSNGTGNVVMCTNGGKVGIGITDGAQKLHIEGGNVRISSSNTNAGGDVYLELWRGTNASWQLLNAGGTLYIRSNYSSAKQSSYGVTGCASISIGYNTGNITTNGLFYANSDIRYKDVIENINPTVEQISKLPIFNYKWNNTEDNIVHTGSSAQAVELILPNLVSLDDNGFKSLDYATLGVVSSVVLARRIIELENEIKQLKEKLK